ncbi:amidohydrolase/deacetylase family metallohydrolase [Paraflavitalea soli]|uniref:Amidohydrolase/deacetylase family metallohydrolase n=1 Tax=Paraflavitalea soli TaxID=2315862 RepID=A0A3B7MX35_9BACT|nr:amidohydrolase/deacetylase family metallohydrolase [Paraflavitalea soli]AXY78033.1 amidohydrolase/deacetylase family metallohydrolase [Paraflavitalea soli]
MKPLFILSMLLLVTGYCFAQPYAIVIKGGHVIDPANHVDGLFDVAIHDGKIVRVARDIDTRQAVQVVHARGLYVTPGLIDLHAHVFAGTEAGRYLSNGPDALPPDGFTFRVGVTTVVDAGGAGWKNFALFKRNIIDRSKTRVLAMLNVMGEGMRGGAYEQNLEDMSPAMIAQVAAANRNDIVGIKVAHYTGPAWGPVDSAVAAGRLADVPVMIDFGGSRPALSLKELFLQHLRPGDIFTHAYANLGESREAIVDETTGILKPFVLEARQKGLFFDVGYGGISFRFSQAIPALKQGFYPSSISTDIHSSSMNNAMKDQLNVLSTFLALGMDLAAVIRASTVTPARIIKRQELGNLSPGSVADVAILHLREGQFGFYDHTGYKIKGNRRLECAMTIRNGKIVYDLNGIATPVYPPRTERQGSTRTDNNH